jgi:cytochrome c biogenesis factor
LDAGATFKALQGLIAALEAFGRPYEILLVVVSAVLALAALIPMDAGRRRLFLAVVAGLLGMGELVLAWFHFKLYGLAQVVSPDGVASARVAVPLWVESEKLFVWALIVAVLGVTIRRHRERLLPGTMLITALLTLMAALLGKPFTQPLPGFIGQYTGYLQAYSMGGVAAQQAYVGMEQARQFYYNAWYMWVHPPMLFLSYGAFAISFVATLKMVAERRSSYETEAYRWARFGYVWLTLGMLLGFPWALRAWEGQAWWWSGKVNMSLMMWLLYTAYLHARLYLRKRRMWRMVAALAVLSFVILVLTYATTYIVPGAHSYALAVLAGGLS